RSGFQNETSRMRYLTKFIATLVAGAALGACSSVAPPSDTDNNGEEEFVRVNREDLAAAERFLVAQAYYQPVLEAQQKQLTESLLLLQGYLDDANDLLQAGQRLVAADNLLPSPPEPETSVQSPE